jgi:hypothetical protein
MTAEARAQRREARESADEALRMVTSALPCKRRGLLLWARMLRLAGRIGRPSKRAMPEVVR